jgi:hypothetical protein
MIKITTTNMKLISKVIIKVGSKIFWNDPTCKDKWGAIHGDFKKFMITWVVSSIMKSIGTKFQAKELEEPTPCLKEPSPFLKDPNFA